MKYYTIIILILGFFGTFGCEEAPKPDSSGLVAATQSAKGTFGCYVNGRKFESTCKGKGFNCGDPGVTINPSTGGEFNVGASQNKETINFYCYNCYTLNQATYKISYLGEFVKLDYAESLIDRVGLINAYIPNCYSNGEVTFTKVDAENRIASGTFWFDALKPGMDTIRVRQGRFDCRFWSCDSCVAWLQPTSITLALNPAILSTP